MLLTTVVLLLSCILLVSPASAQLTGPSPVPYASSDSCREGVERFQSSTLSCVPCGADQTTSTDGLSCTCDSGFIRPIGSQGVGFDCRACLNETVTSSNGLFCLSCDNGYNSLTGECNECPRTHVYVDTLPSSVDSIGSRSCSMCPEGTWADQSGFVCVECGVEDCTSCRQTDVRDGLCFSSPLLLPPSNTFSYYNDHFSAAAQLCMEGNFTSCQLVANLCVLQLYNRADPACMLIQQISVDLLQSIYYPPQSADEVLERTDIQTTLVTSNGGEGMNSSLPLMLASYSLDGSFLGLRELSNEILLCTEPQPRASAVWRVGVHYTVECTVSGNALVNRGADSPVFYELYLRDRSSAGDNLYPIPVLIDNYRDGAGEAVNEESDVGNWQFVHRFFVFESVTNSHLYISASRLTVTLNANGRIFPPYLRVSYSQWIPTDQSLQTGHVTEYIQTSQSFLIALVVLAVLLSVVGVVYSGLKVNGFLRRTGGTCCDVHTFIYMMVMFCDGWSTLLFVLLMATSFFWLVFYKSQYVLMLVLPSGGEDVAFQVLLGLALLFRIVHVVYVVWHQCTVDIFFIDWEKPRGLSQPTNHGADGTQTTPHNMMSAVSIWRTYFVVNEWNELQSLRKINNVVLTLFVLLFAQVVGLERLAERDPSSNVTFDPSRYSAPFSPILRFSITAIFFSLFAAIMRGYVFLIYERYFEHKLRQFVDLCSVSNISVLVLSRQRFGYYIHGKSVHGHADTDMRQMNYNFRKEQEDMCGRRGLEGDDQLFQVLMTESFRTHYDKILAPIRLEAHTSTQAQRGQPVVGVSETCLKAYQDMNYYLSTFIEHGLKDVDYCTARRNVAEKVLDIEFYDVEDKSYFYDAPGHTFGNVLFYGYEWSLFQLDVLLFGVIEVVSNSYPLAAVLTLLVTWMINFVRDVFGKRNIAKKTLVDERFLL